MPPSTASTVSAPSGRRSQAERRAAARQTILEATIDCLREQGAAQLTMADIAERAGVSKGLVHYHFDSKEQLLLAAQTQMFRAIFETVQAMAAELGPSREQAEWALDHLWEQIVAQRSVLPAILHLAGQAASEATFQRYFMVFAARHEALLTEGIELVLGPQLAEIGLTVETIARLVIAGLIGLGVQLMFLPDPAAVDEAYLAFKRALFSLIPSASDDLQEVSA